MRYSQLIKRNSHLITLGTRGRLFAYALRFSARGATKDAPVNYKWIHVNILGSTTGKEKG